MAQPPQPQHRPSFPSQTPSFSHAYPPANARSQFSPQSPAGSIPFSSPSPQSQFPPTYGGGQAPPLKRQRMSPEAPAPLSQPQPQPLPTPQAGSPVNGQQMNGIASQNASRPSSMPPPQQPTIKKEERDGDSNVLRGSVGDGGAGAGAGTGAGGAQATTFMPQTNSQTSFTAGPASFDSNDTTLRPSSGSDMPGSTQPAPAPAPAAVVVSPEEREKRDHERQDWTEARLAQHELWDPFLYGATLNDKIKAISARSNLAEPQSGVLVNTQKNQPPPTVRVNGLEGATRVINQGQSILDTKEKAERLNELVKLLSLSTKARLTGLVQAAARMALERRQHSQGRIPAEWSDLAVAHKPPPPPLPPQQQHDGPAPPTGSSPRASAGMKRTHSQANDETGSPGHGTRASHPAVSAFAALSSREFKAEQARQAKRRKRNEVTTAQETEAQEKAEAEAVAAALENDKKTTKKERKIAETRVSEQQQHASTNEAARMATASLFGRFGGGGKKKAYSWMTGGATTPSRPSSAAATPSRSMSAAAVPQDKAAAAALGPKGAQLGQFNEESEPGIQARDLLAVLETDGRAAKSFVKGSSIADDTPSRVDG